MRRQIMAALESERFTAIIMKIRQGDQMRCAIMKKNGNIQRHNLVLLSSEPVARSGALGWNATE